MLGVYDNWSEWGSMFYKRAMRRKLPLDIGISDICIYFNMIIRRALMIWLVSIIGLLSEMRLGKLRSVIIVVILICAYSCYSRYGVMWLGAGSYADVLHEQGYRQDTDTVGSMYDISYIRCDSF